LRFDVESIGPLGAGGRCKGRRRIAAEREVRVVPLALAVEAQREVAALAGRV